MEKSKLVRIFDRQARIYEKQRRIKSMGEWRDRLLRHAEGKVLELAVGAGANFAFYPPDVEVTAVDFSPKMLEKAKPAADENGIPAEFILSDAETLDFPAETFDTVVSTLSFCGYEEPVHMFNQLNRWCKRDGQVLLMEHGTSSNPVLALAQKAVDPLAYKVIGCHQKRDMLHLIQSSDLKIQKAENHWRGMFHLVWAVPGK